MIPIIGLMLKEKAIDFAKAPNKPDFKVSNGWLTNWKETFHFFLRIGGEEQHYFL